MKKKTNQKNPVPRTIEENIWCGILQSNDDHPCNLIGYDNDKTVAVPRIELVRKPFSSRLSLT